MQKVLAGNTGSLPEFADYLNKQLQRNPGWRIDKIQLLQDEYIVAAIVVFEGPDRTEGPSR